MTARIDFAANARKALDRPSLQAAYARATTRAADHRIAAAAECPEWEAWRERARAIKEHTIENLDRYLEQFAETVRRRGGVVHWARTVEEAQAVVCDLARSRGVKLAIKSKSMVSEEVHLNDALEGAGVEVVETDLGEYIIQLAREKPSHIIAPAIHKSRGDVADLFHEKLGVERDEDVVRLAGVARRILREKFFQGTLGISGVNFGIAETGTIVIVSNEGNARCCTTLPKIHVALMGIERVIPRLADLPVFLRLLPRSGTGQRLTTYVSMISGPRRADEEDGPEEFHLVLLDNGRTKILANPETRETLYCIRCGACLNVCPVYRKAGGHAYGWVYPGPIGAILSPQMLGLEAAGELPYASSLCGACRDACPVKIDIPRVLLHLRNERAEVEKRAPLIERWLAGAMAAVMVRPRLFRLLGRIASAAARVMARDGYLRSLPPPLDAWTRTRDFPVPASKPFRDEMR